MENTYLLTLNQVHSAVERYTTDALFARKLKCKPGFVQRGAVCQPAKSKKGGLGGLAATALAGGALAGGAFAASELAKRQSANQKPTPTQNGGSSIVGGIARGALAGGGVGLLAGTASGLYDEYQRLGVSPDDGKMVKYTRNQPDYAKRLAEFGGIGAGALAYNQGVSNITGNPLDKKIGGSLSGLAGGSAASAGYNLGKALTKMAGNALRKQNQRKMLPPGSDTGSGGGGLPPGPRRPLLPPGRPELMSSARQRSMTSGRG